MALTQPKNLPGKRLVGLVNTRTKEAAAREVKRLRRDKNNFVTVKRLPGGRFGGSFYQVALYKHAARTKVVRKR